MPEGSTRLDLVIFDCDGVLVDSEVLSAKMMVEELALHGHGVDEAFVYEHFLGRSVATETRMLAELGWALPEGFFVDLQARLLERFRAELRPVPGIAAVLAALRTPRCVASSSVPARIRLSLEITGLLPYLEPHLFSSTMVERGKPFPDLFLHAAQAMGAEPERCLVIEDSEAGVQAARAAGMRVLGFTGAGHAAPAGLTPKLRAAGAEPVLASMEEVGAYLG